MPGGGGGGMGVSALSERRGWPEPELRISHILKSSPSQAVRVFMENTFSPET